MSEFLQIKNEVVKLFEAGIELSVKVGNEVGISNIKKVKEKLEKNELVIVVCGEIKRGKSSLLSALLEERELFPINVNVSTNAVTVVRYGAKEKIEVGYQIGNSHETRIISRQEIAEYVTEQGNLDNSKKVEYLYIQTPNPKLQNGMVFVDTPGVGSLNIEHSEITYGYLPNADVVLFVSDALSPLTVSELKFLKTATEFCHNIIFPLTKIDKASDYKQIYESNMSKINEYTALPKEEIKIIPVSNLAKIRYLETNNPMMLKNSNYKVLEDVIWTTISNKRAQILLTPPLTSLAQEMLVIKNNLKIKYDSLTQDTLTTKGMENNLKSMMQEKQNLLEEGADWKNQMNYELIKLFESALDEIQIKQNVLQEMLKISFMNKNILKNLDQLTVSVNEELFGLTYKVKNDILKGVDLIINKTEDKLGLCIAVNKNALESIYYDKDSSIEVNVEKNGSVEKSITVGRNIMMNSSGGGAISALIGGVFGAAIGLLGGPVGAITGAQYGAYIGGGLGAIFGGGKGLIDGIKHVKQADIPSVSKSYTNYVTQNLFNIKNMVLKSKADMIQVIITELNNKIKSQRDQLNQNIKDVQENMSLSKEKAAEKVKIIQAQSKNLNDIEVKISKLMMMFKNKEKAANDIQKNMDRQRNMERQQATDRQHKTEEDVAANHQEKSERSKEEVRKDTDNFSFLRM